MGGHRLRAPVKNSTCLRPWSKGTGPPAGFWPVCTAVVGEVMTNAGQRTRIVYATIGAVASPSFGVPLMVAETPIAETVRPLFASYGIVVPAVYVVVPTVTSTSDVKPFADALYVSVNTIRSHRRSLYRRLGVGSREDAVRVARARGLL